MRRISATGSLKHVRIDTSDHDGLRGICAMWIMLYHCFLFSTLQVNILGNTQLPLYFILSGFSLTIGYYDRFEYPGLPIRASATDEPIPVADGVVYNEALNSAKPSDEVAVEANTRISSSSSNLQIITENRISEKMGNTSLRPALFYYNRFVRTMPIYYIGFLLAIPITLAGYNLYLNPDHDWTSTIVVNIIPVATWLIKFGNPLDGPAWFVQTCIFLWICFPYLLKRLKPMEDTHLLSIIRISFILQMIWVLFFMTLLLVLYPDNPIIALYVSTMFPLSRLPLFAMGICAAILTIRYIGEVERLPWFTESGQFFPFRWLDFRTTIADLTCVSSTKWENSVMRQGATILVLTVILITLTIACAEFYANIWFQAIIVFAHMDLLIGLTLVHGSTALSKVLRHPVALWFGEISFCLFQTHWLVIFYFIWAVQGRTNDDYKHVLLPAWGIPLVCVISLLVAAFLYYSIEVPVRKLYRTT